MFSIIFLEHQLTIHNKGALSPKVTFGKVALNILLQYQQPANLLEWDNKRTSLRLFIASISIMALYWHTLYDIKVRSFIIGQIFDPVAESINEVDVSQYPIFNLDNDGLDEASTIVKVSNVPKFTYVKYFNW